MHDKEQNPHLGSSLDDLLEEEGILDEHIDWLVDAVYSGYFASVLSLDECNKENLV